jgi:hypothetical protein
MKLPNAPSLSNQENLNSLSLNLNLHPARRLSDVTPASRSGLVSVDSPTSPKMHELQEREEAQSKMGKVVSHH